MHKLYKGIYCPGLLVLTALTSLVEVAVSQIPDEQSRSSVVVNQKAEGMLLRSEMLVDAELVNNLDAKRAKAGDEVLLRTTKANKLDGIVVIEKGARVIGRVVDVQAKTQTINGSMIVFTIEQIVQRSGVMKVSTQLVGIKLPTPLVPEAFSSGSESGTEDPHGPNCGCTDRGKSEGSKRETLDLGEGFHTGALRGLKVTKVVDDNNREAFAMVMRGNNLKIERGTTFSFSVSEIPTVALN